MNKVEPTTTTTNSNRPEMWKDNTNCLVCTGKQRQNGLFGDRAGGDTHFSEKQSTISSKIELVIVCLTKMAVFVHYVLKLIEGFMHFEVIWKHYIWSGPCILVCVLVCMFVCLYVCVVPFCWGVAVQNILLPYYSI